MPGLTVGRGFRTEPIAPGRKLLRALAGPFDADDAARFCAAVKARGGDCLVR
jgi:hypothetical protein